jgi:hypothetical protein
MIEDTIPSVESAGSPGCAKSGATPERRQIITFDHAHRRHKAMKQLSSSSLPRSRPHTGSLGRAPLGANDSDGVEGTPLGCRSSPVTLRAAGAVEVRRLSGKQP